MNIKYFHVIASHKKRKGKLHKIQDEIGVWITDQGDIADARVRFFQKQFYGECSNVDFDLMQNCIPYCIF